MFQSLRQGITYVTWVRYQEITRARKLGATGNCTGCSKVSTYCNKSKPKCSKSHGHCRNKDNPVCPYAPQRGGCSNGGSNKLS